MKSIQTKKETALGRVRLLPVEWRVDAEAIVPIKEYARPARPGARARNRYVDLVTGIFEYCHTCGFAWLRRPRRSSRLAGAGSLRAVPAGLGGILDFP
jgi:hypothetical protein